MRFSKQFLAVAVFALMTACTKQQGMAAAKTAEQVLMEGMPTVECVLDLFSQGATDPAAIGVACNNISAASVAAIVTSVTDSLLGKGGAKQSGAPPLPYPGNKSL